MNLSSCLKVGFAIGCFVFTAHESVNAQAFGGFGSLNQSYGYGYGTANYGAYPGYAYNRGYSYVTPNYYQPPQTYNNLNNFAGMINQTVTKRSTSNGFVTRRRR